MAKISSGRPRKIASVRTVSGAPVAWVAWAAIEARLAASTGPASTAWVMASWAVYQADMSGGTKPSGTSRPMPRASSMPPERNSRSMVA